MTFCDGVGAVSDFICNAKRTGQSWKQIASRPPFLVFTPAKVRRHTTHQDSSRLSQADPFFAGPSIPLASEIEMFTTNEEGQAGLRR